MSDGPPDLSSVQIPTARTLYRFFVVWPVDDEPECCVVAQQWGESMQQAASREIAQLTCKACGGVRMADAEIAEIVV